METSARASTDLEQLRNLLKVIKIFLSIKSYIFLSDVVAYEGVVRFEISSRINWIMGGCVPKIKVLSQD